MAKYDSPAVRAHMVSRSRGADEAEDARKSEEAMEPAAAAMSAVERHAEELKAMSGTIQERIALVDLELGGLKKAREIINNALSSTEKLRSFGLGPEFDGPKEY